VVLQRGAFQLLIADHHLPSLRSKSLFRFSKDGVFFIARLCASFLGEGLADGADRGGGSSSSLPDDPGPERRGELSWGSAAVLSSGRKVRWVSGCIHSSKGTPWTLAEPLSSVRIKLSEFRRCRPHSASGCGGVIRRTLPASFQILTAPAIVLIDTMSS
jgi:hypothetical protein